MSGSSTTEIPAALRIIFGNFGEVAESPDAVPKLRELILDLAVRGKLVEQDKEHEPANALLERIKETRAERNGSKRKQAIPARLQERQSAIQQLLTATLHDLLNGNRRDSRRL